MGKEIVYCGDCGKSLREEEFARGKAHTVDNAPYCSKCRPLPEVTEPPPSKRNDLRDRSEARIQRMQATRRYAAEPEQRGSAVPMWIGGGVAAAIALVVVFVLGGGEKKEALPQPKLAPPVAKKAEPPPPPRPRGEAKPAPKTPQGTPESLLREVERFAATAIEPMAVLQRCDEIRPTLRGTPFEARLKEIEAAAMRRQKARQLEKALSDVRTLREKDENYERESEVLSMLEAAKSIAGSRIGEVQGLIEGYKAEVRKARAASIRPAPPKPAPVPAPPVARTVPPGGRIVGFQSGLLPDTAYAGVQDVMLSEEKPDKNYGRRDDIEVDGDSPSNTGMKRVLLFRWDLASIARGSRVASADLTFRVTGKSKDTFNFLEVKRSWEETEANWRERAEGRPWEKVGAAGSGDRGATVVGEIGNASEGMLTVSLNAEGIAMVQRWIDDPSSNFGILLDPGASDDGLDVSSREAGDPSHRPKLTVILSK